MLRKYILDRLIRCLYTHYTVEYNFSGKRCHFMYKEEDLEVKNIIKNVFHFIYFSPNSELFTVCCEMCILLQIETRATFCANVKILDGT